MTSAETVGRAVATGVDGRLISRTRATTATPLAALTGLSTASLTGRNGGLGKNRRES